MKLRDTHYDPLYAGDVAPVMNVGSPAELREALVALLESSSLREARGRAMREWLLRNHGEDRTMPLLLALLRLAADRVELPSGLVSPLRDVVSPEEEAYHRGCLRPFP
jgi:hypothetical protein